jgi:hydroxypyruvate isomerase
MLYSANISFMFAEHGFLDRIDAAKAAGFDCVECHFPYDHGIATLRARLAGAGVRLTGLNTVPGDDPNGWGRAGLPGQETAFRRDFDQALSYAVALGVPMIHVMAAVVPAAQRAAAIETYVANLRAVAPLAAAAGVTLLLEPLNSRDKPDYLVSRSDDIVALLARIGAPNVKLLFDVYHVQIMEGDLTQRLRRHAAAIGHVQIAGVPSRAEPDEGEVSYAAIFRTLDEIGFKGPIGLEYKPRGRTIDGLRWRDHLKPRDLTERG